MIIEPLVWGWTPVMLIMDQKESTAQFLQESHQFLASKNVSSHFNPHPTCSANGIQVKMAGCVGPIKRPTFTLWNLTIEIYKHEDSEIKTSEDLKEWDLPSGSLW
jgi:hypothetical protein